MRRTLPAILVLIFTLCICCPTLAAAEIWACESCGSENDSNFCEDCGAARPSAEWTCPNCGIVNESKFCPECGAARDSGAPQSQSSATPAPTPSAPPVLRADPVDKSLSLYEMMVWDTDVARAYVSSVRFLSDQSAAPSDAVDVSEAGDGGVLLWFEPVDDTNYDMFLAANGRIQAPENCAELFESYIDCTAIHFDGVLDTSSVETMESMFSGCWSLQELDLSSFDTSSVTDMSNMFGYCESLSRIDLSSFDTSKVESMFNMFSDCEALTRLDLSSFDTSSVTDFSWMFDGCARLESLDISSFDVRSDARFTSMFEACAALPSSAYSGVVPTSKPTSKPTPKPTSTPAPEVQSYKAYDLLSRGSSGEDVRALQTKLATLGYLARGEADGKYGRKTAEAVHRFKYMNGISDTCSAATDCVATSDMQHALYSASSEPYYEPSFPLYFPGGSMGQWQQVSGNKLKIRFEVTNISTSRTVTAFKIQAYATDVWGDSLYGDSVYYETTQRKVAPSDYAWSAYLYLPYCSDIDMVYARISEVRFSDGTTLSNPDYDYGSWTITYD